MVGHQQKLLAIQLSEKLPKPRNFLHIFDITIYSVSERLKETLFFVQFVIYTNPFTKDGTNLALFLLFEPASLQLSPP